MKRRRGGEPSVRHLQDHELKWNARDRAIVDLTPRPFPDAKYISAWLAVTWRAFGTLEVPASIAERRSFDDQGMIRRSKETKTAHAVRLEQHRLFDAAERELLNLLAGGQVTAEGRPPVQDGSGKYLNHPKPSHEVIPTRAFLSQKLAFDGVGDLVHRLSSFERICPGSHLRGGEADPGLPLYFDVLILTSGLRTAWPTTQTTFADSRMTRAAEQFLQAKNSKPKRDDLVRDCVAAFGCRFDDAEAAHAMLPRELRRQRGERNRKG